METNETTNAAPSSIETEVAAIRAKRRRGFNWLWLLAPLMLVIGFVAGFIVRPIFLPPTASGKPDAIDLLIAQTKHFKGNANAPITILEFSDFQ